jgi:hypothetical protein
MITEQEKQDHFIRIVGGIKKADRLQQIWNQSYPHYKISRGEDFRARAKAEGFTDKQIDAFLQL